jgi:putative transposase
VALIGKRVLLLYHENEPDKVEVFFNQISYGLLVAVDLHVNCRVKRDKYDSTKIESDNRNVYQGSDLWK